MSIIYIHILTDIHQSICCLYVVIQFICLLLMLKNCCIVMTSSKHLYNFNCIRLTCVTRILGMPHSLQLWDGVLNPISTAKTRLSILVQCWPISCCCRWKTVLPHLLTKCSEISLHVTSLPLQMMNIRGRRLSKEVACSRNMVTHVNVQLPAIIHIRCFRWQSWNKYWRYHWTCVAHYPWGYSSAGLGSIGSLVCLNVENSTKSRPNP